MCAGEAAADQAANGHGGAVDGDAVDVVEAVGVGDGEGAGGELGQGGGIGAVGQAGLEDTVVAAFIAGIGGDDGDVVSAVDGDGQGGGVGITVGILHGVGEGLGEGLPGIQGLYQRVGVIDGVAPGAAAGIGEGAVSGRGAVPADEAGRGVGPGLAVGMEVIGKDAAGDGHGAVLDDVAAVVDGVGDVVDDSDGQGVGVGVAIGIGNGDVQAIEKGVFAEAAGMGFAGQQGVAVAHGAAGSIAAVTIDGQGVAEAGGDGDWHAAAVGQGGQADQGPVNVDTADPVRGGNREVAAHGDRVVGIGGRSRCCRGIEVILIDHRITALRGRGKVGDGDGIVVIEDVDGENCAVGVAVAVSDGVRECLGGSATTIQGNEIRVTVIEGITVGAIGLQVQSPVCPDDDGWRNGTGNGGAIRTENIVDAISENIAA